MEELIHMTAAYSNALFLVVLSNVSDFTKNLELPIPQPITINQVRVFKPSPFKHSVGGELTLTNGDRFFQHHGYIDLFYGYKNFLVGPPDIDFDDREKLDRWAESLFGPMNMTTNEVIEYARDALRKLGYAPKTFHADRPPTRFDGPSVHADKTIPFCRVEWSYRDVDEIIGIDVNANKKQIVGFSLVSTNAWRPDPKLGVEPELESDYRRRIQGTMFVRSNAPPRLPARGSPNVK